MTRLEVIAPREPLEGPAAIKNVRGSFSASLAVIVISTGSPAVVLLVWLLANGTPLANTEALQELEYGPEMALNVTP